MSIRSMTGFGREALELSGLAHTIELRAVNHRFLDVKVRLPRAWAQSESAIKSRVAARLQRGRVDVTLSAIGGEQTPVRGVEINWPLAEAVRLAHATLAERLGVADGCDTATLTAWPGVLVPDTTTPDDPAAEARLLAALDAALDALVEMRAREGEALAEVLVGHLTTIDAHRADLAAHAPSQAKAWRGRFEGRLREMVEAAGVELDEGRVLHELAAFAEKTDVTEELARLRSHVEQARGLVEAGHPDGVGRRLDFICQEMLREANTVGSKVHAVEMTRRVVELKAELERLREQTANIE